MTRSLTNRDGVGRTVVGCGLRGGGTQIISVAVRLHAALPPVEGVPFVLQLAERGITEESRCVERLFNCRIL